MRFPRLTNLGTDQMVAILQTTESGPFPSLTHLKVDRTTYELSQSRSRVERPVCQNLQHVQSFPDFCRPTSAAPRSAQEAEVVITTPVSEERLPALCAALSLCYLRSLSLSLAYYTSPSPSNRLGSGAEIVLRVLSRTVPHLTALQLGIQCLPTCYVVDPDKFSFAVSSSSSASKLGFDAIVTTQVSLSTTDSFPGLSRLRYVMLELFANVDGLATSGATGEELVESVKRDEMGVAQQWFSAIPSLEVLFFRLNVPVTVEYAWECPRTAQNWVRSDAGVCRPAEERETWAARDAFEPFPVSRFVIL